MNLNEIFNTLWAELSHHGCLWSVSLLFAVLLLVGSLRKRNLSHRYLSGRWYVLQVVGALFKSYWSILTLGATLVIVLLMVRGWLPKYGLVAMSILLMGLTAHVVTNLNKIFSLRRQETRITVSQIILLAVFGICAATIICTLDINKNSNGYVVISSFGVILGWIFQDTIKSVVAFFYLRANGLLCIGDWIEMESKGINGIVRSITLTTVQLENWDTTTSAFPVYLLHAEHFKNKQRMLEGRTHGRLMQRSLVVDTECIHALTAEETARICSSLPIDEEFKQRMVKPGTLNIHLFRHYAYHWLMQHPHVCQRPRLFVSWKEQTAEGLSMQLYAFLTDTTWDAFEWQQSAIVEHLIGVLPLFGLRLYQRPSGYDAHYPQVCLSGAESFHENLPLS